MSGTTLYVLDARGHLAAQRAWIEQAVMEADTAVRAVAPLGPTDIVVQAGFRVVPEKGHGGYTPGPGAVFLTVDPTSPALLRTADRSLERTAIHELHHALRWDGPGYGRTLGEALVSEGLACHFVHEVFDGPPEPWEVAVAPDQLARYAEEAQRSWDDADYDHADWFFGAASRPRWLGYGLGCLIVARFLAANPGAKPSTLATAPAACFHACADLS